MNIKIIRVLLIVLMKNCRICNNTLPLNMFSKHSSTKDKLDSRCKQCMKAIKEKLKENQSREHKIYPLDLNKTDWQVGKPAGCILFREDKKSNSKRFEVRIPIGNGKLKSKSFAIDNFASEEEVKNNAQKWLREYSDENGLTKNMIKIVDENTIEVQLTKGKTMITDIRFSDICQMHYICVTKSQSVTAEHYATISINNKMIVYHKYITGNDMTDHINRNPLDNRLANLRKTTHKLNNNNRGISKKYQNDPDHILGVQYSKKDDAWKARIKQDGKEYSKSFSVKKFGDEAAKQFAIAARQSFNNQYQCENTNKKDLVKN